MIIGVCGGTRSGKSTLTKALAAELGCDFISLDDYFLDPSTFPSVYGRPDYDRVEAVDWDRAMKDIQSSRDTLIVEGFLLLTNEVIRNVLDISFYIETPEDVRIRRRFEQENKTDCDYISIHLRAAHRQLVEPSKVYADVILDGSMGTEDVKLRALDSLVGVTAATSYIGEQQLSLG